jgi:hypothetical protein
MERSGFCPVTFERLLAVMNYKTTLILLILLVVIGSVVLFTRGKAKPDEKPAVHTLVDVKSGEVTAVSITDADGNNWSADKTTGSNGTVRWNFAKPKSVYADSNDIDNLLTEITGLTSTAESKASPSDTGTDHPIYTITLTANGKVYTLAVGHTVSDGVYVRLDNSPTADVVSSSFLGTLDRPNSDKPKSHLFDLRSTDVGSVTVDKAGQPPITLSKSGATWVAASGPTTMPADSSDAAQLISAVVDLDPAVVDSTDLARYGLDQPVATIELKPDAAGSKPVDLKVGRYEDIEKKKVYVATADNVIATVPAALMAWVDKKPVEYHDKSVLTFDAADVKKIKITTGQIAYATPTTKPTTKPAAAAIRSPLNPAATRPTTTAVTTMPSEPTTQATTEPATEPVTTQPLESTVTQTIVLTPRIPWSTILDPKLGPPLPATMPTTGPTTAPTTAPTSRPAEPGTKWVIASDHDAPADDAKITTMLGNLSGLRAEKFLDPVPPEKPGKTYEVEIVTGKPRRFLLKVFDPGDGSPLVGSIDGLTFELSTSLTGDISGDFKPGSAPATPPTGGMGGMPQGFDPSMLRRGR